jgi:hypothetical protein
LLAAVLYGTVQHSKHRHVVTIAPENIGDEARVWDYDELSEQAQRAFREAVAGEQSALIAGEQSALVAGVDPGDVVVYTDYYLVR